MNGNVVDDDARNAAQSRQCLVKNHVIKGVVEIGDQAVTEAAIVEGAGVCGDKLPLVAKDLLVVMPSDVDKWPVVVQSDNALVNAGFFPAEPPDNGDLAFAAPDINKAVQRHSWPQASVEQFKGSFDFAGPGGHIGLAVGHVRDVREGGHG